ncbi:MAG: polysaccharide biosynthesis tyrosine autokinase, partial [Sedimentisphaerales bacterium]|nr:polysaccharide biosynthesis tyrosine autokinase [Sedimentisphaerales bacterium]
MSQPGAFPSGPFPSGGLDLRGVLEIAESLLRTAWRHRLLVLTLAVLGPVLAGAYLYQAKPQYAGNARLYVEAKGPKIITEQEGVLTQAKNYVHTQAELIKSSPILQPVVDDPNMAQLKFFAGATDKIKRLKNAISVSVGRNDEIISLSLRAADPAEAALLVNRIVKAYIAYHTTCKKNTAADVLRLLQQEKAQCEKDLQKKLKEIVDFNQNYDICNLSESNSSIEWQQLSTFSTAMTETQLNVLKAQSEYNRLEDLLLDPNQAATYLESLRGSGRYMSSGSMELRLTNELEELYQRRRGLLTECTPEHPALRELDIVIAESENRLAQVKREIIAGAVNAALRNLQQAQGVLVSLEEEIDRQRQEVRQRQEHTAHWTMLQSEVKRLERACDILDSRIKEMDLTEEAGIYNITVVEPAVANNSPVSPNKLIVMAGGTMLGLMAAIGLIFLFDFTDGRLRRADDVVGLLRAPFLGALPKLPDGSPLARVGQWTRLEEQSLFTQTIKEIRAALMYGRRRFPFRTLLVTSPDNGDGKSIFASNLALALTQGNKRVLLIDAQGKGPVCHDIFLQVNQRGLCFALENGVDASGLVQPTACPRLDVLTHGPQTGLWAELLESPAFRQLLLKMRRHYDYVIIDGPSVLSGPDATVLAAAAEAVLVVLHAQKTTRQACRRLAQRLGNLQTHMLGAVVNALDGRRHYFDYTSPRVPVVKADQTTVPAQQPITPSPQKQVMPTSAGEELTSSVCTSGAGTINGSTQEQQISISYDGGA